jgi:hypothetical protein
MCIVESSAYISVLHEFNEQAFALFNSYMTNRTQQVQIGNALSNKCPVKYGVL